MNIEQCSGHIYITLQKALARVNESFRDFPRNAICVGTWMLSNVQHDLRSWPELHVHVQVSYVTYHYAMLLSPIQACPARG